MEPSLENYLHAQIPLSEAMGLHVQEASLQKIILKAPLKNNINHKKTVFGGSLHAVATLACWSLIYVNLKEKNIQAEIVIQESQIRYLAPVTADFTASCAMPDMQLWTRFITMLEKKHKARIHLTSQVYQENVLCVDYQGSFVAIRNPTCP